MYIHENKHQIPDDLQGRSYLEDLDCLGTVLLVNVGGLRMADGLVEAENRKGSGITTGILEANTTNDVKQGTSRDTDS